MDDFSQGGEELREALRHLRRLNRLFGAGGPICYGVKRIWAASGRPQSLSVLDIGAGSGDANRKLLRWAERNRVKLRLTLADRTEEACHEARAYYRGDSRVAVVRSELEQLPEQSADIVTASQFLHHFETNEVPNTLYRMMDVSKLGIVAADIHRHLIPWVAVWAAARIVSRNRYIRHDGPLSVAKGFRPDDWELAAKSLGWKELSYAWRPLFRYAVIALKEQTEGVHAHVDADV